jgi:hypothetical protein
MPRLGKGAHAAEQKSSREGCSWRWDSRCRSPCSWPRRGETAWKNIVHHHTRNLFSTRLFFLVVFVFALVAFVVVLFLFVVILFVIFLFVVILFVIFVLLLVILVVILLAVIASFAASRYYDGNPDCFLGHPFFRASCF